MSYWFGMKDKKGKGVAVGPKTKVKVVVPKRPVSKKTENKHKHGTLIYGSPLFNFLYHHSNGANLGIPISTSTNYTASNELFWVFRRNPEMDPSLNENPVPRPTQGNVSFVYVKRVNGKPTVTVWCEYNGQSAYRTVRFAGSEVSDNSNVSNAQRKPIFYIEVYDPATGKATKKLYGDLVYVKTPPSSPVRQNDVLPDYRSPSRSPSRSPPRSPRGGGAAAGPSGVYDLPDYRSPSRSPDRQELDDFLAMEVSPPHSPRRTRGARFGSKRGGKLTKLRKDLKMVLRC